MHHWPEAGDVADFLVDHFFRKPEARDLAADHAAGLLVPVIDVDFVSQRGEVSCDCEGSGPGAYTRDLLAVAWSDLGQEGGDIALVVSGHPFQAADRHRLLFDTSPPAGGLARPVARPSQDSREDIRLPVDHV